MITVETSNQDIQFRLCEPIVSLAHQILSGGEWGILDTSVKREQAVLPFLELFKPYTWEHSAKVTILYGGTNTVSYDQTINGWIAYVREQFYSISEVEAIYVAIKENNVDIWLLIPNRDFALVRQLVDQEMKVLETFVDIEQPLFLCEFHIVYRCGADESQLVPQEAFRLP